MKTIRLTISSLIAAASATVLLAAPAVGAGDKVTICHFTSSAKNPYVINTISHNALKTHLDHHGDVLVVDGRCAADNPPLDAGTF
jgi:ABC-type sugar transport system substrate-binding protein